MTAIPPPPPPPYAPPPPATTAAPPPPPPRSWLKWVLLGCGAIILLGVLAAAGLVWGVRKATAGPEAAIKSFIAAAAAGDYQKAHDHFSNPLKEVQPYDQFVAMAQAQPQLFQITDTTLSSRSMDTSGAELSGTVTLSNGTQAPARFRLVKEGGEWKLTGYNIGS